MSNSQGGGEAMFCHQCSHEWQRRPGEGIVCPVAGCRSDFTEVIEPDHDPRDIITTPFYDDGEPEIELPSPLSSSRHPLHDHDPWRDEPPFRRSTTREDQQRQRQMSPGQSIFGVFETMMQHLAPELSNTQRTTRTFRGPNGTQFSMSSRSGNFGSFHFEASSSRASPPLAGESDYSDTLPEGFDRQATLPLDDDDDFPPLMHTHRMLTNAFFSNMNHRHNADSPSAPDNGDPFNSNAHGHPANHPLFNLLGTLLNPANARHGDIVYTQEALDRVVSQLMDQTGQGSGPGPTPAAEISQLPKVDVSKDMLDQDTGKASCSICMEDVALGEEVTRLWCSHWFHGECVGAWLRQHDSCPQCRKGVAAARDESRRHTDTAGPAATTGRERRRPSHSGRRLSSGFGRHSAGSSSRRTSLGGGGERSSSSNAIRTLFSNFEESRRGQAAGDPDAPSWTGAPLPPRRHGSNTSANERGPGGRDVRRSSAQTGRLSSRRSTWNGAADGPGVEHEGTRSYPGGLMSRVRYVDEYDMGPDEGRDGAGVGVSRVRSRSRRRRSRQAELAEQQRREEVGDSDGDDDGGAVDGHGHGHGQLGFAERLRGIFSRVGRE